MIVRALLLAAGTMLWGQAGAQEPAPADDGAAKLLASLKFQTGTVTVPGGLATLNLGETFRYLAPADTRKLLEEGWGNPPGSGDGTLGMIVPANVNPLSETGWGVIVTYSDDGHVADDDASSIDYAAILKEMQQATNDNNAERQKAGFEPITLAGWAEPPHYDAGSHKIYWAKDLQFGDNPNHTLNYCIRVLGRGGVLELNAVAGMGQIAQIREDMKQVVALSDVTAGNRYADFNSDTDKVAAYGLAALVAGGVAAKTGLLAKLFALLIAAKKLVFVALAGIAAFFGKLFKKKSATGPVNPA